MTNNKKPLLLIGNDVAIETAETLADDGRFEVLPASIGRFPSGGLFVELFPDDTQNFAANAEKLKGAHAYILQSAPETNADDLQHMMIMADTLKQHGVAKVTVIAPFLPNLRQDRSMKDHFHSVAADLNARQMKASGIDEVITVTPHSKTAISLYRKVFGESFVPIHTTDLFAKDIKQRFTVDPDELVIGAPDGADKSQDEGQIRARELVKEVFGRESPDYMFRIAKTHTGMSDTKIVSFDGRVAGKDAVIVDDMIDGGSTMTNAASLLKAHGARTVTAYATHGVLTGNALEILLSAKPDGMTYALDKLIVADTIPEAQAKVSELLTRYPKFKGRVEVISAAPAILEKVAELEADAAKAPAPRVNSLPKIGGAGSLY